MAAEQTAGQPLPEVVFAMDRIIKITLSVFIIVLVAFVAMISYGWFVENTYRSSLTSTYTYACTISTDSALHNATFFIPVPSLTSGNSPIIARISGHEVTGVPPSWKTELYDTGKGVLVKVTVPELAVPAGTSAKNPYAVTMSTEIVSDTPIDTANPMANSPLIRPVYRPVQDLSSASCMDNGSNGSGARCYDYQTSLFTSYSADPNAAVSIRSTLVAKNSWNVFEPASNEYRNDYSVLLYGEQKGWTAIQVTLEDGIGAVPPAAGTR
jgi:hypothetical protein